ncbi:MAG TPA: hypothetical protein IAC04_05125 [Candidatus Coprenecus stercoravium]|uniref:Uncharacterized protein n=1 Tax=Candidatus Coprenecus stercoravium TaxID=2840735 RepID=A0A9D2KB15_9BACT|nr:hypothetical protein [Candidatus Coprenecus stercoravium]
MRKFITIAAFLLSTVMLLHAEDELKIFVAAPDGITHENAAATLKSNLTQALVLNNVSAEYSRFIMRTDAILLSKDVTPTAPPMYVTELEISIFITDIETGENLSQTSFTVKGIADNDKSSYMDAVKKIKARDPKLRAMINQAKEYYNEHINQSDKTE